MSRKPKDEIITNLQKSPMVFVGDSTDVKCTIPPRSTATVPGEIWTRYKGRKDIEAMDGIKLVIGGCSPEEMLERTKTPEGQRAAIDAQKKALDVERKKLDEDRANMEAELRDKILAEMHAKDPDAIEYRTNE